MRTAMLIVFFFLFSWGSEAAFRAESDGCQRQGEAREGVSEMLGFGQSLAAAFAKQENLPADKGAPSREAAVFGPDGRIQVTSTMHPWRTMGRLLREDGRDTFGICTGTLVGPCHVITAAHCLRESNGKLAPMTFQSHAGAEGVKVRGAHFGSFQEGDAATHDRDWAILKLERRLGDERGWMGVRADPLMDGSIAGNQGHFHVTGHSSDAHGGALSDVANVRVLGFRSNFLLHDADLYKGASGGPMWYLDEKGDAYLVGVTADTPVNHDGTNARIKQASVDAASRSIASRAFIRALQTELAAGCD